MSQKDGRIGVDLPMAGVLLAEPSELEAVNLDIRRGATQKPDGIHKDSTRARLGRQWSRHVSMGAPLKSCRDHLGKNTSHEGNLRSYRAL
jgi:hypothetical protein